MADFIDDFKTKLKAVTAITDLIGAGTSARCYPDALKQNVDMPAIVYVEAPGGESYERLSDGPLGVCECVMQVTAYAATRTAANELAEVIRIALQGPVNTSWGNTHVISVSCIQHRDTNIDWSADKQKILRYWCRRAYRIHHHESTS